MRHFKRYIIGFFIICMAICFLTLDANARKYPPYETYAPSYEKIWSVKAIYGDPYPYYALDSPLHPKQILPQFYQDFSYDVEEMKKVWEQCVGFKSPDVVGKIAPEIKPGLKVRYTEMAQYPGLKELMYEDLYNRIKPGDKPHGGNIPYFEVIATRQHYYALPEGLATLKNKGIAKQDEDGYIIWETLVPGGMPFPEPSGPHRAMQVIYNFRYKGAKWGGNGTSISWDHGYTKDFVIDFDGLWESKGVTLARRTQMEPFGWYDERAEKLTEESAGFLIFPAPRDIAGLTISTIKYLPEEKFNSSMTYVPALRRVRKNSSTDTQDPVAGTDIIGDDTGGWMTQKISKTRFPYKYEILDEREYLVVATSWDGAEYITPPSEALAFMDVKMSRRPLYVLKLTQLDKTYIYGYRIFYMDAEHFNLLHAENYDQKGRLYRTFDQNYGFQPTMGSYGWDGAFTLFRDHLDLHSQVQQPYFAPAEFTRDDLNLGALIKAAK